MVLTQVLYITNTLLKLVRVQGLQGELHLERLPARGVKPLCISKATRGSPEVWPIRRHAKISRLYPEWV